MTLPRVSILIVNLLALMSVSAVGVAVGAAEPDDHRGHDHGPAPTAESTAKPLKKPHVHGVHEDHDEHAEETSAGPAAVADAEHVDEVMMSAALAARVGIVIAPAQSRRISALIAAMGQVFHDPAGQAQVTAPAAGRVRAVRAQPGDAVAVGQTLIEIACPAYVEAQGAYLLKRAPVLAAAARAEVSAELVERGRAAGEGVTGGELKRRIAEAQQAQLAQTQAEAELALALSTVRLFDPSPAELTALTTAGTISEILALRAPVAGVVLEIEAQLGQQVGGGAEAAAGPLAAIADPARLWVMVQIPAAQVASATVGSLAELRAFDGTLLGDGDLAAVAPDLDFVTRTARARLALAGGPLLRAGQIVQVLITPLSAETGPAAAAVVVPESAVISHEGRAVVFVADAIAGADGGVSGDLRFRAQGVRTGASVAGLVSIITGLEAGTPVVVQGAFVLKADLGKEGAAHEH